MDVMLSEGPMITGTWYNPKTGHSFTAKDTYFEDDKIYVLTTDGQRLDYNMLSQYVQSNKPGDDKKDFASVKSQYKAPAIDELETPLSMNDEEYLMEEDRRMIYMPDGKKYPTSQYNPGSNPNNVSISIPTSNITPVEDEDDLLVRRLLKRTEQPFVDYSIKWNKFPAKQLEMLEMMGVETEKIVEYYVNLIDIDSIKKGLKDSIIKSIEGEPEIFEKCDKKESVVETQVIVNEPVKPEKMEISDPETENKKESVSNKKPVKKPVRKQVSKTTGSSKKQTKK